MSATPSHPITKARLPIIALLAADGVSRAGNAITNVAIPLLALQLGGPWATAAAGVAATLPLALGGLIGGVVIDRLGFRRASILADLLSGLTVLAVPLLAAIDALPLWALLLIVFASNLLDLPGMTARSSQLPELTELAGTTLTKVAAAKATISRTALMVGSGLGGLLVATVGAAAAMYVNVATFAVAVILTKFLVPMLPLRSGDTEPEPFTWASATAGIRFVWHEPLLRAIVGMVVITNAIDAAGSMVLRPLYTANAGDDGSALGLLVAVSAAGALLGAALYGLVGDRLPRRTLYVTLFLLAGAPPYLVMAQESPFWLVLLITGLAGLAAGPLNPLIDEVLYRQLPAQVRARALSTIWSGVVVAMPVGSALAGAAVDAFGLAIALNIAAVAYLGAILALSFGKRWQGF